MRILRASEPEQLLAARRLFRDYIESLGEECCGMREFQPDLQELPGPYGSPFGRLLLAMYEEAAAGCAGLKFSEPGICEMKRLYVRPEFRGEGIGRALAVQILSEAKLLGYHRIRLDTVPNKREAITLYESVGFRSIPAFRESHDPSALFFELVLD